MYETLSIAGSLVLFVGLVFAWFHASNERTLFRRIVEFCKALAAAPLLCAAGVYFAVVYILGAVLYLVVFSITFVWSLLKNAVLSAVGNKGAS